MRSNTSLRPIFGLIFCGMLLIAPSVGGLNPAAAFGGFGGGFGRMGGFGPRAGIHPGARKPMMTQRRGGGGVDRPSRPNGGNVANQGGRWPAHHGIVGRSRGGGYYGGEGGGNSNNGGGGGGMPPRGERRFVPNEVITAFSPNATPQAIEQLARRYSLTQLESQSFPLIRSTLYRWRIGRPPDGRRCDWRP